MNVDFGLKLSLFPYLIIIPVSKLFIPYIYGYVIIQARNKGLIRQALFQCVILLQKQSLCYNTAKASLSFMHYYYNPQAVSRCP